MADPVTAGIALNALAPSAMGAGALASGMGGATLGASALGAPITASLYSGMTMPQTLMGLGKDLSAVNSFMNANPITSQIGFGLARDMMQGPAPVPMPGGMPVQRSGIQPMDYMSLLNPQQSQVLQTYPISLL